MQRCELGLRKPSRDGEAPWGARRKPLPFLGLKVPAEGEVDETTRLVAVGEGWSYDLQQRNGTNSEPEREGARGINTTTSLSSCLPFFIEPLLLLKPK